MVDAPENLVLAQLRAIRADLGDVQSSLGEIKGRLANLEGGQASIIQHLGHLAALVGERRLDLRDA
jgi:hypothetical protein